MNRKPPTAVLRQLRREIGFGCPVPGCGSPYLKWHHFDPPWDIEQHHRPEGMIALCSEHHDKADAGSYTLEQLRAFKRTGLPGGNVSGRFDWLRRDLMIRVGSNFYFRTPTILTYGLTPLIWFTTDDYGHLLANMRMVALPGEPRWVMQDSFWMLDGTPEDVVCPPSGRLIEVKYPNQDRVKVEFREIASAEEARQVFPEYWPEDRVQAYPATTCDITYRIAGTTIDIGPSHFRAGGSSFSHCSFIDSGPISLGDFPGAAIKLK